MEIVEITDADNRTVTVYFSQLTKLPVRQQFKRRNPQYKDLDTEVTVFAKYRDVGGGVNGLTISAATATARRSSRCSRIRWRSTRT